MSNISTLRFIDKYLISIGVAILILMKGLLKVKSSNKKVLIIRLWALGDCINVLPICKKLHSEGYRVQVLTTSSFSFVFSDQNFIEKIYIFNFKSIFSVFTCISSLRKTKFEFAIDTEQFMNTSTVLSVLSGASRRIGFSHLLRSKLYTDPVLYIEREHFVQNFSRLTQPLGIIFSPDNLVELKNYSKKDKDKVDKLLKQYKGKKLIGIHMGTGGTALGRRWPPVRFLELSNLISNDKNVIVFTGLQEEKLILNKIKKSLKLKNSLDLTNKLSLGEFVYLMKKFHLFISNDTGPMHIAAAMKTQVIGIFGMNHPGKVGPWPLNKNVGLYRNPKGKPIINNKYSIYPDDSDSTIDLITVDEVYKSYDKIIGRKNAK